MNNITNLLRKGNIYNIINRLKTCDETLITKKNLINMMDSNINNRIIYASQFTYNEMPLRFSKRIKELEELPFNIDDTHLISTIREWYIDSLNDILDLEYPDDLTKCKILHDAMKGIYDRHTGTLVTMAGGLNDINRENININKFLDNFYTNRTRTRLLTYNFLSYFDEQENHIGAINLKCNINKVIERAVDDLNTIVIQNRLEIPTIKINIEQLNFQYIDSYLYYPILEILKNSTTAVNNNKNEQKIINISSINDDKIYVLKIEDNGIGIKDDDLHKIWNYNYTSVPDEINSYKRDFGINSPISGFGYGLPISDILIKTFGGSIKVFSEYGIGTQVYITINKKHNWYL